MKDANNKGHEGILAHSPEDMSDFILHANGTEHVFSPVEACEDYQHEDRWIEAVVGGRLTLVRNPAFRATGIPRSFRLHFCPYLSPLSDL